MELTKAKPQELSNYSKNYGHPKLTSYENNLLAVKYQSLPLGRMSDEELNYAARLLLLKIHVIAGWPVPEKELKNILSDQFIKKIKESYQNVNTDEIEYAFRHNTTVKDWGKSINLVLIDEVLREYLEKRMEVSQLEEKYKELPASVKDEDVLSDEDFIEANKAVFRATGKAGLVSIKCYNILLKQGKISRAEGENRDRIIKTATSNFFSLENSETASGLNRFEQERFIEQDCKRIMICNYFNTLP